MDNLYIACALALMVSLLYMQYQRDSRKGRSGRGQLFSDCAGLLTQAAQAPAVTGFPTLKGNYQGYRVTLAAQVDTLSMRKVPPLWLVVTVIGKHPTHGTLDILVRPQNTGIHGPAWEWNDSLPIPPGWPRHAMVKHGGTVASLDLLENFVPELFADEKVKELLLTPELVRITYLAKQADRGEYMLLRNAVFDGVPIQRETVARLLASAATLRARLEGAMHK